jgi:hypothetical protein
MKALHALAPDRRRAIVVPSRALRRSSGVRDSHHRGTRRIVGSRWRWMFRTTAAGSVGGRPRQTPLAPP